MKKLIILLIFLPLINPAQASEITGFISTNPNNLPGQTSDTTPSGNPVPVVTDAPSRSGGDTPAARQNRSSLANNPGLVIKEGPDENLSRRNEENERPRVLGLIHYPAGTLFRDSDKRVYVFDGQVKKHLKTIDALKKYAGQKIIDLPDQELSLFPTRVCLDGDLIRQKGDTRVFHLSQNRRQHIRSLSELANDYFGREIINIEETEMLKYEEEI